jgi:hypothetical protein
VARAAWRTAGADLPRLIRASLSGRELIDSGFPRDVDFALEQEVSSSAPLLVDGVYQTVLMSPLGGKRKSATHLQDARQYTSSLLAAALFSLSDTDWIDR